MTRRGSQSEGVIIRLADEGVPIAAIARALMKGVEEVGSTVAAAMRQGIIAQSPMRDWPAGTRVDRREPATAAIPIGELVPVATKVQVFLDYPSAEARFLAALLLRGTVSYPTLLAAVLVNRAAQPEILKVYACHVRASLKRLGITLQTVWGRGYRLSKADRKRLLRLLDRDDDGEADRLVRTARGKEAAHAGV